MTPPVKPSKWKMQYKLNAARAAKSVPYSRPSNTKKKFKKRTRSCCIGDPLPNDCKVKLDFDQVEKKEETEMELIQQMMTETSLQSTK